MWFLVRQHKMNAISSVRLNLAAERQENLIVFYYTILYFLLYGRTTLLLQGKQNTQEHAPPPPHVDPCYFVLLRFNQLSIQSSPEIL